jgi:putative transposase
MAADLPSNLLLCARSSDHSEPALHRVLWAVPGGRRIVLFDCSQTEGAWPTFVLRHIVEEQLESGALVKVLGEDPFVRLVPTDVELDAKGAEARRGARDRRWAAIQGLVEDSERRIYQRGSGLVAQAAALRNIAPKTIYVLLRLFWRRGQVKNAVAPDFHLRGGPGNERIPGPIKRGRQPLGTTEKIGINVDASIAEKLQRGWIEFVDGKGQSHEEAHRNTLEEHFAIGVTVDAGGRTAAILPPAEQSPSLAQFVYWGKKIRDPKRDTVTRKGRIGYEQDNRPR